MGEWDDNATQIRAFAFDGGDRILIADANRARADWLRGALGDDVRVEQSDNSRRVFERLTADPPRILVVGTDLIDVSGTVLLAHAARHQLIGHHKGPIVFLIADTQPDAPSVDEQAVPIFYRITPELQPARVRELFQIAFQKEEQPVTQLPREDPARTRQVIEHAKRFGVQTELKAAAGVVEEAIRDVLRADRARVLYFDDESGMLWTESKDGTDEYAASVGITGFVARTGMALALERAAMDPAYRTATDDPAGTGSERFALCPVRDRDNNIHAVIVAIREAQNPAFDFEEQRLLRSIAEAWGPFIHQLALEADAANQRSKNASGGDGGGDMFRQEAIAHMVRRGHEGDVVRVNPAWVSGAYWVVLASIAAGAVFCYFVHIHQYSQGSAVVRVTGRNEIISYDGGTVTSVEASNGETVKAGQVLVRLHDTEQATTLRTLDADFERKLVAYLQTPSDAGVRSALGDLVSQREKALAGVDARVIRAPVDGTVKDLRVHNGQRVEAGGIVASIAKTDQAEGLSVIAFLPGADRPRLRAKQALRLTLPGYRGVHFDMPVHAIGSETMGAKEATARYLGERFADTVPLTGSVVVVEGRLPSAKFSTEGQIYELHDGMLGTAEVQLDSRSVLSMVLPGLQ